MSKKLGYSLIVIGFVLILLNAIDYVSGFFGLSLEIRTSMIIGLVLVALGMFIASKKTS